MIWLPTIWTVVLIIQVIGGHTVNVVDVVVTVGAWGLLLFLSGLTRQAKRKTSSSPERH